MDLKQMSDLSAQFITSDDKIMREGARSMSPGRSQ